MLVRKVTPAPQPQPVKAERPTAQKPRDLTLPVLRGPSVDFGVI
ncbi:hypothetical protein V3W47_01880 [Deinococcus sp. YIM 134068]